MTSELRGSFTQSAGREVSSATIDLGDSVARPLTLMSGTWRVTVPLPQSVEEMRTVALTAHDASMQTTTTTFQLVIDTLGPRTTLTTPSAGTAVGAMTRLEGTAVDPATPIMSVTVDPGSGPQMATVAMNGAWQVDVAFPPNLNRVQRPVTIAAVDALGNQSAQMVQVLVDTQGPVLSLTSPSSTTAVGANATLSGTATDATGAVSNVTIDIGGGPLPVSVQGNGSWSVSVTFPPNLDRMSRTVTLRGQDPLGNVTQTTAQVLVDTQGPALAFVSPATNERLGVPAMQPVTGTVSDASGVTSVTVDCADGAPARSATVTSPSWNLTWPLPTADHVSFVCTATASDPLGNTRVVSRSFFVDTVAPVITIQSPAASALLGGPSQSVSVTAGLADGSNLFGTGSATLSSSTVTGMIASSTLTATVPLPAVDFQSLTLSVTATDAEGNSATATRSVTVDRVAPALTITAPTSGQVFNIASIGSGAVTLSWTMSDADPSVEQRLEGVLQPAAARSAFINTSPTDNNVSYTRTLVVTDRAGNSTSASRSFTVDRVAPSVLGTSPVNATRMNNPRTASVTFSETMSTSNHGLTGVGGGTWNGAQTTWTSNPLAGSTVFTAQVNASATDAAGNPPASLPTWSFHTAPLLPANNYLLATNVVAFDAVSDIDGQPFIGFVVFGTNMAGTMTLNGATGLFDQDQVGLALPAASFSDVHVQIESRVGAGLGLVRTRSINGTGQVPPAFVWANLRRLSIDEAGVIDPTGLPVVSPSILLPFDGDAPIGYIVGSSYQRGAVSYWFASMPAKVIPGASQWGGFSYSGALQVAHRYCGQNPFTMERFCTSSEGTVSDSVFSNVLESLSGAVSNTGCFIYSYDGTSGRRVQVRPTPFSFGSTGNTFTSIAAPGPGFTASRRSAGGHFAAWELGGGTVQLSRTTNTSQCTAAGFPTNWTPIGTVSIPAGSAMRVVELSSSVAVVYLSANELRIVYP